MAYRKWAVARPYRKKLTDRVWNRYMKAEDYTYIQAGRFIDFFADMCEDVLVDPAEYEGLLDEITFHRPTLTRPEKYDAIIKELEAKLNKRIFTVTESMLEEAETSVEREARELGKILIEEPRHAELLRIEARSEALEEKAKKIPKLREDRDKWKRRAEEAERKWKEAEERLRLAPPLVERPPPIVIVPKGLSEKNKEELRSLFIATIIEQGMSPSWARARLDVFRSKLRELQEGVRDMPRPDAMFEAERDICKVAIDITPPPRVRVPPPPRAPPPVMPPPPVRLPPMVVGPPVAPPPGVMRKWGLPWAYYSCPAHLGEGVDYPVLRSPPLEAKLRMLGIPTNDPLFFKLCEEHRQRYGGAFELFPRYKTEYWVGEALGKGEIDIGYLVGIGIPQEYCMYCWKYYNEHKKRAIQ